jgi:hypothetical protein
MMCFFLSAQQEVARGSLYEPALIMLRKNTGEVVKIGRTNAWNWQQGCMLQWYQGKDDLVFFNDYDPESDRYIPKVVRSSGELVKTYSIPVNNVSRCGRFALSLNYDRLAQMRPDYGYFNKINKVLPGNDQDGIWYLDLEKGTTKLIITLEQLKHLAYAGTMEGAIHKVNHIDINSGGSRFMFLYRWIGPQGRFMRLITANQDGSDLYILNGDIMTSHCCWLGDQEILSFCEYKGERGYFKFYDRSNKVHLLSSKMPKVDGHPSLSPARQWIITDTYPDKSRMSYFYLYDPKNDQLIKLGRFFQPFRYKGEMRIDLHPKWSADGRTVFFESGHDGARQLFPLKVDKLL